MNDTVEVTIKYVDDETGATFESTFTTDEERWEAVRRLLEFRRTARLTHGKASIQSRRVSEAGRASQLPHA